MEIPLEPYVALYGSHSGDWRDICIKKFKNHNISWYDPTDKEWRGITEENGDSHQTTINRLVAKQHEGILNASCVLFHLAARKSYHYKKNKPNPDDTNKKLTAFAARCELGFLIGKGIPTFAYIEPNVEGRNYLWAAMKDYEHMVRAQCLEDAIEHAVRYVSSLDSFKK